MFKHYRQSNGVFHETLPEFHWLSPIQKISLNESNASTYGYFPATNFPNEYGAWLIQSGVFLSEINKEYESAVAKLVADTPNFERESWPKQETEARNWVLDNNSATPYVDILAATRGVPREALIAKIIEKADMYKYAHAYLTGLRQAAEKNLSMLDPLTSTHEDVIAIMPNYVLI